MFYGTLTEQGRKEFGTIFPNNLVPLVTPKVHVNVLATDTGKEFYFGDYRILTERQQFDFCHLLGKKFNVAWQEIHKEFMREWKFPIRKELITISTDTRYIG